MRPTLRITASVCALLLAATLLIALPFVGCTGNYTGGSGGGLLGGGLLDSGTSSFFRAVQVDPRSEDSAGPQFVVAEDLDSDGLLDLVSAWNQSQPVQIHLQRRNALGQIQFQTTTLAGNVPVVSVAGLTVADFDRDGAPDIAVLLKETYLENAGCLDSEVPAEGGLSGVILIYLGPADAGQVGQALAWQEVAVEASRLAGAAGTGLTPESGGFTAMRIGDIDNDTDMDLVVAWNSTCGDTGDGGATDVVVFNNQGPAAVRDGTWTFNVIPNPIPAGTAIRDVALGDIDADGDLDIVATFPDAGSMNVRWFRNPIIDDPDDYHIVDGTWQVGTVGQVATQGDIARIADIDRDGLLDVVVRSAGGRLVQWLRGPGPEATTAPLPQIPWQVYTLAEFNERSPQAIAVGNLNFDDSMEVVASAGGALLWLDSTPAASVYDQWTGRVIVDDGPGEAASPADPSVNAGTATGVTLINSILIVDLDGDGDNDIVATLDRSTDSGISDDALVWFRSTLR